jgi:hypothetical protein
LTITPLPDDALEISLEFNQKIINALSYTLVRNPVQALGWNHLANVRIPPRGDCENAMAALRQSFNVAAIEPDLLPYRLELAARCPLAWDAELLDALRTDLLSLYSGPQRKYLQSRAFVTWLAERPQIEPLVRRLLSQAPEQLAQLERDLKRFNRQR